MKKISTLLLLAVGVLVLGTVSSCKDYDEDAYNEIRSENASLKQTLDQQVSDLQALIAKVNGITSCNCNLSKPWEAYVASQGFAHTSDLSAYMKSSELEAKINEYLKTVAGSSNVGEVVNAWISTSVGKSALENIIKDYLTQNNYNPGASGLTKEDVEGMISGFVKSTELNGAIASYLESVGLTTEVINNLKNLLAGGPYVTVEDYTTKIGAIDAAVAANAAKLTYVVSLAQNDSIRIDALEAAIKGMASVSALTSELKGVRDSLSAIYENAVADHAWITLFKVNYSKDSTKVWNRLTVITDSLVTLKNDIANSLKKANEYTDTVVAKAVNELRGDYKGTLGDLNANIVSVEKELKLQIDTLKTNLGDLTTKVNNIKDDVDVLTKRTNALVDRLNKQVTGIIVQGAACPLLWDATLALPVNLQSNVLCAYYGAAELDNIKFPSTSSLPYVAGSDDKFTSAEVAGVDRLTFDQGDELNSTAGKVYLTVNPNTVDFTGARLKLVDSQNNEAGIRLKPLAPSNKVLYFGASRAADNGFYEAEAELVNAKKAAINTSGLKTVGNDVVKFIKTRTGIKKMVSDVLAAVYKTVKMPAYAVQAPYSWTDENGVEQTAFVHSNYSLAATAIKPISYNLPYQLNLDDKMQKLPHKQLDILNNIVDRLKDTVAKFVGKINLKAVIGSAGINLTWDSKITFNIEDIVLNDITIHINEAVKGTGHYSDNIPVTYTYEVPQFVFDSAKGEYVVVKDASGAIVMDTKSGSTNVSINKDITVDATINFDKVIDMSDIQNQINKSILAQIQKELDKINGTLETNIANMNKQINDAIDDMLADAAANVQKQLDNAIDDIVKQLDGVSGFSQLNSLIDLVNNVLTQVYERIDNISYYLQPKMFCGSQLRLSMMGASANYATVTKGDMILYPSSFLAETINPAYKKFVKVVNVTGGSAALCQEAMDKANAVKNMNKVIDGNVRAIKFDTDAKYAGLTYEIAYAAMDFTGHQTVQRYFVKVVK